MLLFNEYIIIRGAWASGSPNPGSFFQKIPGSHSGKFLQKEIFTKGIFYKKVFRKRKIFEDGAAGGNFEVYKRKFLQKEIFTKGIFYKKEFFIKRNFAKGKFLKTAPQAEILKFTK